MCCSAAAGAVCIVCWCMQHLQHALMASAVLFIIYYYALCFLFVTLSFLFERFKSHIVYAAAVVIVVVALAARITHFLYTLPHNAYL